MRLLCGDCGGPAMQDRVDDPPIVRFPAVIGRWKQRNVRRLRSVWWMFATYVMGAAWRRSAPLRTKRAELVPSPAPYRDRHADTEEATRSPCRYRRDTCSSLRSREPSNLR